MRRILLVLSVAALMVAMMVATAMPAFAAKGGIPNSEQGKGKAAAPGQVKKAPPPDPCGNIVDEGDFIANIIIVC